MNTSDRSFVYTQRTDILKRFKTLGWQPPERHAEEMEVLTRAEGALRAMKRIQTEHFSGNVTPLDLRARVKAVGS